ncbi:hypothetical protein [Bacillus cereus group sp. BfR-BA-01309]|uniref:hypothetical protein n=1 Tax=Bacillus cereus group sp. BfR-BA-01309 TaxID=2920286 RepID=UPI001F576174|nr:hypothetical protein [Bacillus cereus group sp. BfR-BA-01309]
MEEEKLKEIMNSLDRAISFSPHDWSSHHRLAWIYGIICGWDDASLNGLQEKFSWDNEAIERLKSYHEEVKKVTEGV